MLNKIIYFRPYPKQLTYWFNHNTLKIKSKLALIKKNCIFAPLINRGREPQNLIIRLCL